MFLDLQSERQKKKKTDISRDLPEPVNSRFPFKENVKLVLPAVENKFISFRKSYIYKHSPLYRKK